MRYLKRIKHDFENLSMKNKLLAVVLSNVVLILLIALIGLRISSNAYNEQLYKAIAGNLSFSSQTISSNLKSIETLSSVIISSSVIQDSQTALTVRMILIYGPKTTCGSAQPSTITSRPTKITVYLLLR